MSISIAAQPNQIPVDGPTRQQVNALVRRELNSERTGPNATEFQTVDKLDISPRAKKALEDTLARQELTLSQGAQQQGQPLSTSQAHYVYNGSVYNAIMSYASGEGSLQGITQALTARGQRIDNVLNHPTPGPTPLTPSSTASATPATASDLVRPSTTAAN